MAQGAELSAKKKQRLKIFKGCLGNEAAFLMKPPNPPEGGLIHAC